MPKFNDPATRRFYEAARNAFKSYGLSRAQFDQAVTWAADSGDCGQAFRLNAAMEQAPGQSRQQLGEAFQDRPGAQARQSSRRLSALSPRPSRWRHRLGVAPGAAPHRCRPLRTGHPRGRQVQ
jgi:hypothetical protein